MARCPGYEEGSHRYGRARNPGPGTYIRRMRKSFAVTLGAIGLAHSLGAQPSRGVGSVRFETSCAPTTQPTFVRAVALLHSFEFGDATKAFNDVLATDSTCAMAYWGIALSSWGNPFAAGNKGEAQLQRGLVAIDRGRALKSGSERERGFLDAAAKLFDNYKSTDQRTRVIAYRDALGALAARYPRDDEAAIFSALAIAFAADPNDKSYKDQHKAGAILKPIAARQPNHPGIAHYLIHTYDIPALADEGLPAANRYATIAPASAHAQHMPSHTFTRVGQWNESVAANTRSAKAALDEGSVAEALHASDYMMYAYLQTGHDTAAARVLAGLPSLAERFDPNAVGSAAPPAAGFFAMAAIPARYAIERGDWKRAAALTVRASAFPFTDAISWFARGIGAARSGDTTLAAESVRQLQRLHDVLTEKKEVYWSQQVEIQRRGVDAWLTWARGSKSAAITAMRQATEMEAATEKNAMTPGPLLPAREMLGEMLLANGDGKAALREFEQTLEVEPRRFRALAGAMSAATTVGDNAAARRYARQIAQICEGGDRPGRPELARAREVAAR